MWGPDATIRRIAVLTYQRSESQVAATVESLTEAGLVVADQPVRFVHPLVRSAIYQDMGPVAQAWWHARVARSLADSGVSGDRVASHLMLVEPAGDSWAVDVLCSAAHAANARGGPDAAAVLYRRALGSGLQTATTVCGPAPKVVV